MPKVATKNLQEDEHSTFFLLAFENTISDKLNLGYNAGIKFNEDSISKQYVFTTSLSYSLSNKIETFIEYFGNYHEGIPGNNIDTGILLLLKKNLQLDLAGGTSLKGISKGYFITTGVSYRF